MTLSHGKVPRRRRVAGPAVGVGLGAVLSAGVVGAGMLASAPVAVRRHGCRTADDAHRPDRPGPPGRATARWPAGPPTCGVSTPSVT